MSIYTNIHHILCIVQYRFTVGLQGGWPNNCPSGYIVSAYDFETGALNMPFFDRLSMILKEADKLGMAPIVQWFYWGQIARFNGNNQVIQKAIDNVVDWFISDVLPYYDNILIDVANECNMKEYDGLILKCNSNMTTTIKYIKQYLKDNNKNNNGYSLHIGSSLAGATPNDDLISVSDIVLLHGNDQTPTKITNMVDTVRSSDSYKSNPIPILFNEDPNFDFNASSYDMKAAIDGHASWGYYDQGNNDYVNGYQSPPTNWGINTNNKAAFFETVQSYTK